MSAPIRAPAWRATTVDAAEDVIKDRVLRATSAFVYHRIARALDREFMQLDNEAWSLQEAVLSGIDDAMERFL